MVTVPPHIDKKVYKMGQSEFEKAEYDNLRNIIQSIEDSDLDFSDTIMNIQGQSLGEVTGVSVPNLVGSLTISEYIKEQADAAELSEYDMALEDAFISWEAGALSVLKQE